MLPKAQVSNSGLDRIVGIAVRYGLPSPPFSEKNVSFGLEDHVDI